MERVRVCAPLRDRSGARTRLADRPRKPLGLICDVELEKKIPRDGTVGIVRPVPAYRQRERRGSRRARRAVRVEVRQGDGHSVRSRDEAVVGGCKARQRARDLLARTDHVIVRLCHHRELCRLVVVPDAVCPRARIIVPERPFRKRDAQCRGRRRLVKREVDCRDRRHRVDVLPDVEHCIVPELLRKVLSQYPPTVHNEGI